MGHSSLNFVEPFPLSIILFPINSPAIASVFHLLIFRGRDKVLIVFRAIPKIGLKTILTFLLVLYSSWLKNLSSDFSRSKLSQAFIIRILIFCFQSSKFWFLFWRKSIRILEDSLANLNNLFIRIICPVRPGILLPEDTNFRQTLYPNSVPLFFRLLHYDIVVLL